MLISTASAEARPTISGTPDVGQTLTANPGGWSSYRWQSCDPANTTCADASVWSSHWGNISGATSRTYTVAASDRGKYIRVLVLEKKDDWDASAPVGPVPSIVSPPPPGSISGSVFNDIDASGGQSAGEGPVAGATVYIDSNGNDGLDSGEQSTTSDSAGDWAFGNLPSGSYSVRLVSPASYECSAPSGCEFSEALAPGENSTGNAFGTYDPSLDLSIAQSDSADPVETGGALTYTIDVTNHGARTATGVQVSDPLPTGTTFTGASSGCGESSGTVTCNIGSIGSGAKATVTVSVTAPSAAGTISNTATVDGNEPDLNGSNNSDSEDTTVNAPPPAPPSQLEPDHGSDFLISNNGGGTVLIKVPGSKTFVPVSEVREIPFGSIVQPNGGVATIVAERGDGTNDTANFWGSTFVAEQPDDPASYFVAKVRSKLHCSQQPKAGLPNIHRIAGPEGISSKSASGPRASVAGSGRLWGSGTGKFRTRGRGGAATVRGTTWWTRDSCHGTFFGVTEGIGVDVNDPGHKGLIFLQPGELYFAQI